MADNTIPTTVTDDAVNAHGGRDRWLAQSTAVLQLWLQQVVGATRLRRGEFSGLLFPTRRRVTARSADGAAGIGPILVSIDFGGITVR